MPSAPRQYLTSERDSSSRPIDCQHQHCGVAETISKQDLLRWRMSVDEGIDDLDDAHGLHADWADKECRRTHSNKITVSLVLLLEAAGGQLKLKALLSAATALNLGLKQDEIRRVVLQESTSFKVTSSKGCKDKHANKDSVVSLHKAKETTSALNASPSDCELDSSQVCVPVEPRSSMGFAHAAQLASMLERGSCFAFSNNEAPVKNEPVQTAFNSTSGVESVIDSLAFASHCYGHQVLEGQSRTGAHMAAIDCPSLLAAFDAFIREHGFLNSSFVRAQLDAACKARKVTQWKLLKDPHVGELFLQVSKMLFFIDTTVHVAFATCPLVTFHDLESTLLRSDHFQGKNSFKEAGLGDLRYHPDISSLMKLRRCDMTSDCFPKLSGAQLLTMMIESFEKHGSHGQWNAEQGLRAAAKELGLDDYRQIGVYIQRDRVLEYVLFKIHPRREGIRNKCDALVQRAIQTIGPEHITSCTWNQWSQIFCQIKSLESLPQQFYFVQRLLLEAMGGSNLRNSAAESAPSQLEHFIQTVLAPLFLLSVAAAHVTWQPQGERKDQPRELAQALVALKQLLPRDSPGLDLLVEELQEPTDPDAGLEKVLLKAEGELVKLCGLEHPGQLPLSLAELIATRPELSQALARRFRSTILPWGMSGPSKTTHEESSVLDHVLQLLQGEQTSDHPEEGAYSFVELIRALGHSEAELCKARGVETFKDLGFHKGFGYFMARHAAAIVEAVGPAGLPSSSLLGRSLSNFCKALLEAGVEETSAVHRAAAAHFGTAVSNDEIMQAVRTAREEGSPSSDSKLEIGMSMQVLAAQGNVQLSAIAGRPALEPDAAARRAVERIFNVPPLLDLSEALVEWLEEFEPSLGSLGTFLKSNLFAEISGEVSAVQKGRIVEVRRDHFIRVLNGNADEFAHAMAAKDARAAAAEVLGRWLRDGAAFPVEQFEDVIERHYSLWEESVTHMFLLTAVAALPRDFRKGISKVFVHPYLKQSFPKNDLSVAAQISSELTVAARWIGQNFGILEWEKLPWAQNYSVACVHQLHNRMENSHAQKMSVLGKLNPAQPVAAAVSASSHRASLNSSFTAMSDVPRNENEKLCRNIARLKAVNFADVDLFTREWLRLPDDEEKRALQETVQGAVRRLAADLYSADAHYLLELLQNVDDCEFPDGALPSLKITLEIDPRLFTEYTTFPMQESTVSALLVLEHNEVGFTEQNVSALCNIAHSTKTSGTRKFIGAKGIGFKSVFRATPTPIVHSRGDQCDVHFHFDAAALGGLGYIVPFPLACPSTFAKERGTRLVLPLHGTRKANDICARLCEDLRPHLLLFLRKLQSIDVVDTSLKSQRTIWKEHQDEFVVLHTDVTASMDQAEREAHRSVANVASSTEKSATPCIGRASKVDNVSEKWYVYRWSVEMAGTENIHTELQLAFRFDAEVGCSLEQQPTFAWLPLRSYGFRFILQADWVVPSSREAIVAANPWNQRLRDALPYAFKKAATMMTQFAWKAAAWKAAEFIGLEDETNSLPAKPDVLEALHEGLMKLYKVVPLPGETAEFFAPTPQAILQDLSAVKCLLVRQLSTEANQTRQVVKLELPQNAVRANLPRHVGPLSADVNILEPLLNASGKYVEVGGIPPILAEALAVPPIDSKVALNCLQQLERQRRLDREHSASDLEVIHLLLAILAFEASPPVSQLKTLAIIPTADGDLCSMKEDVYDVDSDLAGALQGVARALDSRFKKMMHPKVAILVRRMGVQQTDGARFLQNVLIPALTQRSPPPSTSNLVALLCAARRCLSAVSSEYQEQLFQQLRGKVWICVTDGSQNKSQVVQFNESTILHTSCLPRLLRVKSQTSWLVPSEQYTLEDSKGIAPCALSWDQFWLKLGAWPAVAIESCRTEAGATDYYCSEMRKIILAVQEEGNSIKQREMAVELIQWLAPHGCMYNKFLSVVVPEQHGAATSSDFAMLLHGNAWIPTMDDVRMPSAGWLPQKPVMGFMAQFCFLPCVEQLLKNWPGLNLSQKPTVRALIYALDNFAGRAQQRFRILDISILYEQLAVACEREQLSILLADRDMSRHPPHVRELITFLQDGRWVFIPDPIRQGQDGKRWFNEATLYSGTFCAPQNLVFKDPIELLDGYSNSCSDAMRDLAWEGAQVRVVGEYYYGPLSRPWRTIYYNHKRRPCKPSVMENRVHALFCECGVRKEANWFHYLGILRRVHLQNSSEVTFDNMQASDVESAQMRMIVDRIMVRLTTAVEEEWCTKEREAEDDGADDHNQLAQANYHSPADQDDLDLWPAMSSTEAVDIPRPQLNELDDLATAAYNRLSDENRQSDVLVNFVIHAANLKCVYTLAHEWAVFANVFYIQDSTAHEWSKEACRFIASLPSAHYDKRGRPLAKRAWEFCGLNECYSQCAVQVACRMPARENETDLARATLLAAIRSLSKSIHKRFLPAFWRLWEVGCAMNFLFVGDMKGQFVAFVDGDLATSAGIVPILEPDADMVVHNTWKAERSHPSCLPKDPTTYTAIAHVSKPDAATNIIGFDGLHLGAAPVYASVGTAKQDLSQTDRAQRITRLIVEIAEAHMLDSENPKADKEFFKGVHSELPNYIQQIAEKLNTRSGLTVQQALDWACNVSKVPVHTKLSKLLHIDSILKKSPSSEWERIMSKSNPSESQPEESDEEKALDTIGGTIALDQHVESSTQQEGGRTLLSDAPTAPEQEEEPSIVPPAEPEVPDFLPSSCLEATVQASAAKSKARANQRANSFAPFAPQGAYSNSKEKLQAKTSAWQGQGYRQGQKAHSVPPRCKPAESTGDRDKRVASGANQSQYSSTHGHTTRPGVLEKRTHSLPPRRWSDNCHMELSKPSSDAPAAHSQPSHHKSPSKIREQPKTNASEAYHTPKATQPRKSQPHKSRGRHSLSLPPAPCRSEASLRQLHTLRPAFGFQPLPRGDANGGSTNSGDSKFQSQAATQGGSSSRKACSQPANTRRAYRHRFADFLEREQQDSEDDDNEHQGLGNPHDSVDYASAKIDEKLIRASLNPKTGHLREPDSVTNVLWRIFYENGGMGALSSDTPNLTPVIDVKPVSELSFSHDTINSKFSNGDHKRAGVNDLLQDLSCGRVDPMEDDRLRLNVVRYKGGLVSLNNRRLYALKEYQRLSFPRVICVRVRILALDATTVKFVLSYTTKNAGKTVELR